MIVISDTTPIISFLKIEKLDLLKKLYGKIIIPKAVYSELTNNAQYESETELIRNCDFIQVEQVKNTQSLEILKKVSGLDLGESEALCLFNEQNANLYATRFLTM